MQPSTFEEVIRLAIRKEADAANFYTVFSELAGQSKAFFKEMAREELKHKEMLENLDKKAVDRYKFQEVPDLRISDYPVETEFSSDIMYQDALIIAMKREEKSVALYTSMAKTVAGSDLEKLFRMLIQEESKHKLRLEREYDNQVLTEN